MKRILPILLLLVLIGAGGGYYFLGHGAAASEDQEQVSSNPAPAAGAPTARAPVYVEFNPILLPIIGDGRIEQTINVVFTLEVADQAAADRVIALSPRLNDAFLQALYGALHSRNVIRDGVVDLSVIKLRLVQESNRIAGHGVVRDALVQMISQQPR